MGTIATDCMDSRSAKSRRSVRSPARGGLSIVAALGVVLAGAPHGLAQTVPSVNAKATREAILLGVDRGISSLPPSAGQSINFRFDPGLGVYTQSPLVGPTALRTPLTIGEGNVALRVAASYFAASQTFGPAFYSSGTSANGQQGASFANGINLAASAKVWVTSIGATVGFSPRAQLSMSMPIVNVHASASQIFTQRVGGSGPGATEILPGENARTAVKAAVGPDCAARGDCLEWASRPFPESEVPSGNGVNLGRSEVAVRYLALPGSSYDVALELGSLLPSPDEDDYAGTNTIAIVPRVIAQWSATDSIILRGDVGYEYDFDAAELRRFIWNVGTSFEVERLSLDVGFGGSQYAEGIEWAPKGGSFEQGGITFTTATDSSTETATTSASFLFGVKAKILPQLYALGAVNVPVTSDAFEPTAIGTWGLEYYF